MATKYKHTHKYYRAGAIWNCAHPEGCSHFMPEHYIKMLVGRKSLCWGCGREFVLTEYHIFIDKDNDKPTCMACSEVREQIELARLNQERKEIEDNRYPHGSLLEPLIDKPNAPIIDSSQAEICVKCRKNPEKLPRRMYDGLCDDCFGRLVRE